MPRRNKKIIRIDLGTIGVLVLAVVVVWVIVSSTLNSGREVSATQAVTAQSTVGKTFRGLREVPESELQAQAREVLERLCQKYSCPESTNTGETYVESSLRRIHFVSEEEFRNERKKAFAEEKPEVANPAGFTTPNSPSDIYVNIDDPKWTSFGAKEKSLAVLQEVLGHEVIHQAVREIRLVTPLVVRLDNNELLLATRTTCVRLISDQDQAAYKELDEAYIQYLANQFAQTQLVPFRGEYVQGPEMITRINSSLGIVSKEAFVACVYGGMPSMAKLYRDRANPSVILGMTSEEQFTFGQDALTLMQNGLLEVIDGRRTIEEVAAGLESYLQTGRYPGE